MLKPLINRFINIFQKQKDIEFLFDEERNVAVFTTTKVIKENLPILYVFHNEDDGAWQFHCGEDFTIADAMIVSLEQIVKHDNTVNQVFDLPMGYRASRKFINDKWLVEKYEQEDD